MIQYTSSMYYITVNNRIILIYLHSKLWQKIQIKRYQNDIKQRKYKHFNLQLNLLHKYITL